MEEKNRTEEIEVGPEAYRNWHEAIKGRALQGTIEYNLYSDAYFTGQVTAGCGPYQFLNPLPPTSPVVSCRPTIILRVNMHLDYHKDLTIPMHKTDTDFYHGGDLVDEIAALLSLCLGVRIKAGGRIRMFDPNGDMKGSPHVEAPELIPYLPLGRGDPILPGKSKSHKLQIDLLTKYPNLTPPNAIALVRASKFYQDAIWISESQPELSWLMLVSAMEPAAVKWCKEGSGSALEQLRHLKPSLANLLENACAQEYIYEIANNLRELTGVLKKFLKFAMEFMPPPPPKRPPQNLQHDWSDEELRKSLIKIYEHRSSALHSGIPFPTPMCMTSFQHAEWEAANEIPGILASSHSGTWIAEDMPMTLHIFEYIVRNVLLNWWQQMGLD